MKRYLFFLLFSLTFGLCSWAQSDYRDVVYLKNGTVIKGFYKDFYTGDSLRMETIDGGILVCAISDIERIAKEKNSVYLIKEREKRTFDVAYRSRGYMGFVEYGNAINTDDDNLLSTIVSTVHGYQFNPHLFLGGGFSFSHSTYSTQDIIYNIKKNSIAVLADLRINILSRSITPYVNLRGGYSFVGLKSPYADPAVGVDFGITPHFGINVALGYRYRFYRYTDDQSADRRRWNMHDIYLTVGLHF